MIYSKIVNTTARLHRFAVKRAATAISKRTEHELNKHDASIESINTAIVNLSKHKTTVTEKFNQVLTDLAAEAVKCEALRKSAVE